MKRRTFLAGLAAAAGASAGAGWLLRPRWRDWLRPEPRVTRLDAIDPDGYDVCIIGSGPAGAVLGIELAQQGIRTLILESGLAAEQAGAGLLHRLETYEVSGDTGYPLVATRARVIGGTSSMWTGRCSRFHPLDFERNAYTPADAAWPITYQDIEPYYERAERTLRVRGGPLSAYHAPRRTPLPPPEQPAGELREALDAIGVTVDFMPTSEGRYGPGPIRVQSDLLPDFTRLPSATFVTGATVTRLEADATGRVAAVETQSLDGVRRMIRPGTVVVACGAVESARLLLLSRSARFPAGIGNGGGQVGRWFMEHPNITLRGQMPRRKAQRPGEGARCHQFYDEFKRRGLGSVLLRFYWYPGERSTLRIGATLEMRPSPQNRVTLAEDERDLFGSPGTRLHLAFGDDERRTLEAARTLIVDIYRRLGARDVDDEPMTWSHHHMGTCRMGDDPRTSVVDRDLRVHGSPNLYVLSSAAFVTGGAAHPTLLIAALAHRLGEQLAARLRPRVSAGAAPTLPRG